MPDARTQRAIDAVEAAWPHLATDAFVEQVVEVVLRAADVKANWTMSGDVHDEAVRAIPSLLTLGAREAVYVLERMLTAARDLGRRQAIDAAYACRQCGERHVWQWRNPADHTRGGSWASRDGHAYHSLLPLHLADELAQALASRTQEVTDAA